MTRRHDRLRGLLATIVAVALACCGCSTQAPTVGSVSRGPAVVTARDIAPCPAAPDARKSVTGVIRAEDGTTWTTPAELAPPDTRKLDDLYNDCSGVRPEGITEVDLDDVPIVEIDPGGEVVTGYLLGDNYFELSVNGRLVGVDPVPYTPFNAVVVRFRVNRPVTYAVKLVDWREGPRPGYRTARSQSRPRGGWRLHRQLQRRHRHRFGLAGADLLHRAADESR